MKTFNFTLLFLVMFGIHAQTNYTIQIPENKGNIDETNNIILCAADVTNFENTSIYENVAITLNNTEFLFNENPGQLNYQQSYSVTKNDVQFKLYFTELPLVSINIDSDILDDPKRPSTITYTDAEQTVTAIAGIELRGTSSQRYPKKNYDLEFWEDETGDKSENYQFGNLRNDDDWVLDALYNEPLRIRSQYAHKLWLNMHVPHYINDEDEAKSGADGLYVELFLNGSYNGIYLLLEQVDRKQLKLKKPKDDEMRGELYNGASWVTRNVVYEGLPDFDNTLETWGGQELKYPDVEEHSWQNLYDFTALVKDADQETFDTTIADNFQIDNAIDYFLYLNTFRGTDNRGRNIYTAKYSKNDPYFYVPWDLDAAFGTNWNGDRDERTIDLITNGLFDRLFIKTPTAENKQRLEQRWNELRNGLLSNENLISGLLENYTSFKNNLIYEREALIWNNYPFDEAAKDYLVNWIENRMTYLDSTFNRDAGSTLSVSDVVLTKNTFAVFPNPAYEHITVISKAKNPAFTLLNLQGIKVHESIITNNEHQIDLGNLAPGIYILNVTNSEPVKIVKL